MASTTTASTRSTTRSRLRTSGSRRPILDDREQGIEWWARGRKDYAAVRSEYYAYVEHVLRRVDGLLAQMESQDEDY